MKELDWTDPSPPFEQPVKVIFTQMHTLRDFIQGRLGFEVVFDKLNRFFNPLSAILLGVMVLGEQLGWNAFVGMGLIFLYWPGPEPRLWQSGPPRSPFQNCAAAH